MSDFTLPRAADWRDRAACAGKDVEIFFPQSNSPARDLWVTEAKRICGGCPVVAECRTFADDTRAEGVWGGTTDAERWEALKAQGRIKARGTGGGRRPAACGTDAAYRRHALKGEPIDDLCAQAHENDKARRRKAKWTTPAGAA